MRKNDHVYPVYLTVEEWKHIFQVLRQVARSHPVDDLLLADAMERELVDRLPKDTP